MLCMIMRMLAGIADACYHDADAILTLFNLNTDYPDADL